MWIVVCLVGLSGCGEPTPQDKAETARRSSSLACNHFRNIMNDLGNETLTPTEAREKLKEVDDNASIATPEVQTAATAMLRAATQDDGPGFLSAVGEMDQACEAAGH